MNVFRRLALVGVLTATAFVPIAIRAESLTNTPGPTITIGSGINLTDTAVLSGTTNPMGTINFVLFDPSSTIVDTETDSVTGNGAYTTPTGFSPTTAGTYTWRVTYPGDSVNSAIQSLDKTETVDKASPFINTTPGGTVALGSSNELTDSATLSGGFDPTGFITFTLFDPGATVVETDNVTVSGNGKYTTPVGFAPTLAGTYVWTATYSGDANNRSFFEAEETESVTASTTTVPEPSSLAFLFTALAALGVVGRVRRKSF